MTTKQLAIAILLFASTALGHAQQAKPLVSPDVLPDGRVTFRLNAPKADEVILTGEFLDGPRTFAKDADGLWSVTVGPVLQRFTITTSRSTASERSIPPIRS